MKLKDFQTLGLPPRPVETETLHIDPYSARLAGPAYPSGFDGLKDPSSRRVRCWDSMEQILAEFVDVFLQVFGTIADHWSLGIVQMPTRCEHVERKREAA